MKKPSGIEFIDSINGCRMILADDSEARKSLCGWLFVWNDKKWTRLRKATAEDIIQLVMRG